MQRATSNSGKVYIQTIGSLLKEDVYWGDCNKYVRRDVLWFFQSA